MRSNSLHNIYKVDATLSLTPLMTFFLINGHVIRCTLVDNGTALNMCSIDLLHKIKVDTSLIQPDSLHICDLVY